MRGPAYAGPRVGRTRNDRGGTRSIMKRSILVIGVLVAVVGAGVYYVKSGDNAEANAAGGAAGGNRGGNQGRQGGGVQGGDFGGNFGGGGGFQQRLPMTVETASVKRADMSTEVTVVGNLIGARPSKRGPKSPAGSNPFRFVWAIASAAAR